ncbi:MAG: hypothetical protein SGJ24_03025 [Chloroflexota bacterium]|nr:hypothetical protein [Chloroflexota bacterium]
MIPGVTYVVLETPADFERAADAEIAIWGLEPRDAVPAHLIRALTLNDGVMLGAVLDDCLIGVSFAFAASRGDQRILWSHFTGVLPEYQKQGVGDGLKNAQRQWAVQHGFDAVRWTFDPLQRGNANFNIARLGAIVDRYHIDFYGIMTDAINAGLPSDRVEAVWDVRAVRAVSKPLLLTNAPFLLRCDAAGHPVQYAFETGAVMLAAIPAQIDVIKATAPQTALAWRHALRETLITAFAKGYRAVDFASVIDGDATSIWVYVLESPAL